MEVQEEKEETRLKTRGKEVGACGGGDAGSPELAKSARFAARFFSGSGLISLHKGYG